MASESTATTEAQSARSSIDVVLFDLGGVFIELGGMEEMIQLSGESNEDEIWRRWLTCPWVRRFERGECDAESFGRGIVETWSMATSPEAFLEAFEGWPKGLLPGARALLDESATRMKIACLSNTNALHVDRQAREYDLYTPFEHVFLSHEMGLVKPDRAAYDFALDGLGCAPDRVLFLDDNQINVDGARAAGLRAERTVGPSEARAALTRYGLL